MRRSRVLEKQAQRLADINSALIKAARDVALRLEAARIMLDQGRRSEAAIWMLSALRYDSGCREAHEFLADFFFEQGEAELAQTHSDAARSSPAVPPAEPQPTTRS